MPASPAGAYAGSALTCSITNHPEVSGDLLGRPQVLLQPVQFLDMLQVQPQDRCNSRNKSWRSVCDAVLMVMTLLIWDMQTHLVT